MQKKLFYLVLLLLTNLSSAQPLREVALTIDDLPLVASKMDTPGNQKRATERFMHIIDVLKENNIPTTGFVIAGSIAKGQQQFLEKFAQAGFIIGNHTYSHGNLNRMNAEKYIQDIARADKILKPLLSNPHYFRYPYLAEGNKKTKPQVLHYLQQNDYIVAPVTIDSKDFRFNEQLYKIPYRHRVAYLNPLKKRYLTYIWQQTEKAEKRAKGEPVKQILLIHANLLNSYLLADIIAMYKKNGYTFISLSEALKNPAPSLTLPPAKPGETEEKTEEELSLLFINGPRGFG